MEHNLFLFNTVHMPDEKISIEADDNDIIEVIGDDEDESTIDSDEKSKEDSEENDNSLSKKKSDASNFKKLSKANKAYAKKIKELEAQLSKKSEESEDETDDDINDDSFEDISFESKVEMRFFMNENPGAKDYESGIKQNLDTYPGMSIEDAFNLAKAKSPQSKTVTRVDGLRATGKVIRKTMSELTEQEAVDNLSPEQYIKYQRSKGLKI